MIKIFLSDTHDPWFNLATEDWLFQELGETCPVLFLWRNDKTVVIGRAQNPWVECNLQAMDDNQVKLARRQSGGGAVFHDLGNTNFTFISPKKQYNKTENLNLICSALRTLGIDAYPSGRNDILVDVAPGEARKISGSAFRETKTKCFHHGTLLLDANLDELSHYLNPSEKKLKAKGITSVRSRVINLSELTDISHDDICHAIIEAFRAHHGLKDQPIAIEHLDHHSLQQKPILLERFDTLKSWDWRFGRTLPFTHELHERFDWGEVRLHLVVKHSIIEECACYTDCLQPEALVDAWESLPGQPYVFDKIKSQLEPALKHLPYYHELVNWLKRHIP